MYYNMQFTLDKSIEINPILLTDTFHKTFFFNDIQSSLKTLELLNSNNNEYPMIERGNSYGVIIIFSKSSNKYYLFYREPYFKYKYTYLMTFKTEVEKNTDEYSSEQLLKLLSYFNLPPYPMEPIFKLIKNTEPIRFKCINLLDFPNDYVINYSHDMRLPERITRNPFLNEISKDKISYYNYIVDKQGIIIGEVFDSLENGVVHHLLVENPDDEVYIAGEIKIENNKLEYNFYSGTYSEPQKTASNPILTYYLDILIGKLFKLHNKDTPPLEEVKLVHNILLPRKPFTKSEIEFFCSRFINRIVKVPDGNRCINNTYNNLLPAIKAQIMQNFATNSNLLCDDYDKLFPSSVAINDLVEEHSIFDTIENELKKFGLNKIKLGTFDELKAQFRTLVDNPLNFATFKEGVIVDAIGSKSIEYNRIKSDGSTERKIFTFKKFLSSGSFNKTDIYIDKTTRDYKEYIFRSSTSSSFDDQFKSFYENLKHIILYIIIRKRLGNIKFIPQPYHFGLKKESTGKITLYMIMEKGKITLDEYIEKTTLSTEHIKKLVFSIYCDLYDLNSLCIKDGDISTMLKFKHNDFKCNNLVVSEIGAPLIIDFGLSRFTLTDSGKSINFTSCEPVSIKSIYYTTNNGYNVIHDILQLIASFNFISKPGFKPFEILKFINNKGSNILDTDIIIPIINSQFGPAASTYSILFRFFYYEFDLRKINHVRTIEITPSDLAYNIGLTLDDRIIDKFEKKYKKYKIKYLNLVNKFNIAKTNQ